jgi:hypothetical protein
MNGAYRTGRYTAEAKAERALGNKVGLDAITRYLRTLAPDQIDALRGKLRIGVHRDVEVTEAAEQDRPRVLLQVPSCGSNLGTASRFSGGCRSKPAMGVGAACGGSATSSSTS